MGQTFKRALTERAWCDPDFARLREDDRRSAVAAMGGEVSDNVRIGVRVQRQDTLYFVISPLAEQREACDRSRIGDFDALPR